MFRDMRRTKQLLPAEEAEDILRQASAGVLAVSGDDDYPYAVPLSYAYADGKLYFHLATSGHKLDGIRRNEKVSFCVIAQDEVVRRAVCDGLPERHRVWAGPRRRRRCASKRHALELLARKYSPGLEQEGAAEIEKDWDRTVGR